LTTESAAISHAAVFQRFDEPLGCCSAGRPHFTTKGGACPEFITGLGILSVSAPKKAPSVRPALSSVGARELGPVLPTCVQVLGSSGHASSLPATSRAPVKGTVERLPALWRAQHRRCPF